jgi:uncharacterized protein YdhG (YjbR/CyaY superfamily)
LGSTSKKKAVNKPPAPPGRASPPATFNRYLASLSPEKRDALERLRRIILRAMPDAEECISYGVPSFRWQGKFLVAMSASSRFCSFYPGSSVQCFKKQLKGFNIAKGTIRFQPHQPIPATLVRQLVQARLAKQKA